MGVTRLSDGLRSSTLCDRSGYHRVDWQRDQERSVDQITTGIGSITDVWSPPISPSMLIVRHRFLRRAVRSLS
jgi:hypothetical protein